MFALLGLAAAGCGPGSPGPDAGLALDAGVDTAGDAASAADAAADAEPGLDAAADADLPDAAGADAGPGDGGVQPPDCPDGDDFLVPDDPEGTALGAAAAVRPGGFVVAWAVTIGIDTFVRARLLDECGVPLGDEIAVDESGLAIGAPVAAGVGGADEVVVAWSREDGDGEGAGVLAQRFDDAGTAAGGSLVANEETFDDQVVTAAAALPAGFALAWVDQAADLLVRPDAVLGVFDARGGAVTGDLVASPSTDGPQDLPSLAAAPDGSIAVAWAEAQSPFGRRRDAAGAWSDDEALALAAALEPALVTGAAGTEDGYSLCLTSFATDAEGDVSVVLLPAQGGEPAPVEVSATPAAAERDALCAARPGGGWVVAWTDETERDLDGAADASGSTVRGAWLSADGTAEGAGLVVPTTTDFDQDVAGLAAGPGGALFVWLDASRADGDRDGGLRAKLIGLAQQPGGGP
jgi:hypothetical protein